MAFRLIFNVSFLARLAQLNALSVPQRSEIFWLQRQCAVWPSVREGEAGLNSAPDSTQPVSVIVLKQNLFVCFNAIVLVLVRIIFLPLLFVCRQEILSANDCCLFEGKLPLLRFSVQTIAWTQYNY